MAGVSVSIFSLKLLYITGWAILRLAKRLVKTADKAIVVWLFELLFLLFLPICLFLQLYWYLVKVTRLKNLLLFLFLLIYLLLQLYKYLIEIIKLKDLLLSNVYMASLFDNALFAIVI